MRPFSLILLATILVTQADMTLFAASRKAAQAALLKSKYESFRLDGDPHIFLRNVLEAVHGPEADEEIATAGAILAVHAAFGQAVLNELRANPSPDTDLLRAELLVSMARGDELPDWQKKRRTEKPVVMPTAELGRRAGDLLHHEDPFVRGLAEWAIAIRLHADYECAEERVNGRRVAKSWPDQNPPEWYRLWTAIPEAAWLELDYVRQAAGLGIHRRTSTLIQAGETLVQRGQAMLSYVKHYGSTRQFDWASGRFEELQRAQRKLVELAQACPKDLVGQRKLWLVLRRSARAVALANPDLNFAEILFAIRQATPAGGNITAGRWNVHTPGGDIYVKQGFDPETLPRPLLQDRLGPGHVRGLDLNWGADRLVFAYARQPGRLPEERGKSQRLRLNSDIGGYFGAGVGEVEETSHLYEMNIDGSGLHQLTDARYNADQEPAYLPNGDIVFVSDRSNFGSQCAGALEQDNMILNLYRCDPNGRNLRPLSNNKDFDRHPHVMDDGQLLFLHWEYQERHLWQTHTLWTCRPDGTMTDAIYKQHIESGPMSLREARQIPGSSKLVAVACGHHNWAQGAVFLADYSAGINERDGMRNVTPNVSGTEGGYGGIRPVPEGGVQDAGGHYMFPYPLSENSFLVAYSYKRPESSSGQNYCLYYIDLWGNKELVHRDRKMSVAYLMPLRPTPRPPVLPDQLSPAAKQPRYAVVSVADVHAGWPTTETRRIKYIRISQKVPWPCVRDENKACGFNDLHWMPAAWEPVLGMWDWGHARVIGIVPVETDGSAHFKVPADQTVYFQALDEDFLELRRMRSNVTFPAGENRSCIGCHESKAVTPPHTLGSIPLALRRPPSKPEPPPWGDRIVPDFAEHIQPILDRHCIQCHGETEPKGGLDFTARQIDGYLQSYRTLFGLKPADPTPFAKGYWAIWHPNEPALSEEAHAAAKTWLKNVLRNPPPNQLVSVADYTGGAGVTEPEQFGSGKSKLTLTLLRDEEHRREVKLSRDEWIALVTWVDLNAQYWGTFVEKDGHYASRRKGNADGVVVPPRRVRVEFPNPWQRPPAGEWMWEDQSTVVLRTE